MIRAAESLKLGLGDPLSHSSPYGIRTRVTGVRGQRPKPLDERAKKKKFGNKDSNPDSLDQNQMSCR